MKNLSVKMRITVWATLLMALLAGLLLAFLLAISSAVASQTATSQLSKTVAGNLGQIGMKDGRLEFGSGFGFYQNGVSTLIYSKSEALLAGQVPLFLAGERAFEDGSIRKVSAGQEQYLVHDVWLPIGEEDGVWVRGILEAPENRPLVRNLLLVALVTLPVFTALAAFGSFRIVRRAFAPLEDITATASAINEARDLYRRINLPLCGDEFGQLAAAFDQLFARLERSFEAEKQFTADASHELRTPVSIIKGACEYAKQYDETPEERQETISMIYRQAVRMSGLISQLLGMTRLEQGTEAAHRQEADLGELLHSLCEAQAYDKERLTLGLSDGMVASADPLRFSQLAQNLIDNAFLHGGEGVHVWVSLWKEQGEILLKVQDDGIGIAPEHQEKIWQRFYQVDASRSGRDGAGLGLALVQQIARLHGGYMALESVPGSGSAFTFHLPL